MWYRLHLLLEPVLSQPLAHVGPIDVEMATCRGGPAENGVVDELAFDSQVNVSGNFALSSLVPLPITLNCPLFYKNRRV